MRGLSHVVETDDDDGSGDDVDDDGVGLLETLAGWSIMHGVQCVDGSYCH